MQHGFPCNLQQSRQACVLCLCVEKDFVQVQEQAMLNKKFQKTFNPFGVDVGKIRETEQDLKAWQALGAKQIAPKKSATDLKKT